MDHPIIYPMQFNICFTIHRYFHVYYLWNGALCGYYLDTLFCNVGYIIAMDGIDYYYEDELYI